MEENPLTPQEGQHAQEPTPVKLVVSEVIRSHIYETTKWTKFLGIAGFVFSAFIMLAALSIGAVLNTPQVSQALGPLASLGQVGIFMIYAVIAVLYFYPSLLMYKFSSKARQGILYGDQLALEESMEKIKQIFKFYGIITLVIVVIYLMIFLFAIIGGLAGA